MEIKKLVDLNSLRTAPLLSSSQIIKLLEELESNILDADWITVGIMAPHDFEAIEVLKSISRKYTSIKFRDLENLLTSVLNSNKDFHLQNTFRNYHLF